MSASEKKKMHILLGLLALLFLSAFFNFSRTPLTVHPATSPRLLAVIQETPEQLPSVSALEKNPKPISDIKRNIFQFGGAEQAIQEEEQQTLEETEQNPETAQPALPDIHYLGFYLEKKPSRVKLGAISNEGQIYVGGVGDILASRYQILQLHKNFIVIKLLQENKILRVPLGKENAPTELRNWKPPQATSISGLQTQTNQK